MASTFPDTPGPDLTCMNLKDRTILGSLAANSENPSYRTRAGRNPKPDTYTLRHYINSALTAPQEPFFLSVVSKKA